MMGREVIHLCMYVSFMERKCLENVYPMLELSPFYSKSWQFFICSHIINYSIMKILVDSTDDRLFLIYQGGLQMMSDVSFKVLYTCKPWSFIGLALIARHLK